MHICSYPPASSHTDVTGRTTVESTFNHSFRADCILQRNAPSSSAVTAHHTFDPMGRRSPPCSSGSTVLLALACLTHLVLSQGPAPGGPSLGHVPRSAEGHMQTCMLSLAIVKMHCRARILVQPGDAPGLACVQHSHTMPGDYKGVDGIAVFHSFQKMCWCYSHMAPTGPICITHRPPNLDSRLMFADGR